MLRLAGAAAATIEAAARADLAAICDLLDRAKLPTDDLVGDHAVRFWVARTDGHLLGAVGLERRDGIGLLRSLIVAPKARGTGLGRALTNALEATARAEGIGEIYLLTQGAERFFTRQGYAAVDRATAPAAIQATQQFRSLCPASAACMHKSLT